MPRAAKQPPVELAADATESRQGIPEQALAYPEFRYMGSKKRLLPWIHSVFAELEFDAALDPFSASGCVAYLLKAMGNRVIARDFLNFGVELEHPTIH